MRAKVKSLIVLFAVTASLCAYSQNGAGGSGFGGGGFGGGGLRGGDAGLEIGRRPEDDQNEMWKSRVAILTPGDRVEFKLTMRAGETVMASASSEVFDAALSIEDAAKHVLAQNDDRADGDQSPFLTYRFASPGTYILLVKCFRPSAGGKFLLRMRTFVPADANLGLQKRSVPVDNRSRVVFRISAKKDKVYELRPIRVALNSEGETANLLAVVGPTGVELNDFERIQTAADGFVFKALTTGDYYVDTKAFADIVYTTDLREVRVAKMKLSDTVTLDFGPKESKLIEFDVVPDTIVRTSVAGADLATQFTAPTSEVPERKGDETFANTPSWAWFKLNRESESDVIRIFHGRGVARLVVSSSAETPRHAIVTNRQDIPQWLTGITPTPPLQIGESRFYVLQSSRSELMRVLVTASHFQPRLDIFRMDGALANSLCDRLTHTAADALYFPEKERFLVRVGCDGHGGSGQFMLQRESIPATTYDLGKKISFNLAGGDFRLYAANLVAGQRYQLVSNTDLSIEVLDDDGVSSDFQHAVFEKVEVRWFSASHAGRHRIWIRGPIGLHHLQLAPYAEPNVDGTKP